VDAATRSLGAADPSPPLLPDRGRDLLVVPRETSRDCDADGRGQAGLGEAARTPVPPARVRAVEEFDEELRAISEAHTGTHGVAIFDLYSGESASLNADRRFVAASLSKLYALLTSTRQPPEAS
jgi:hypothetical protein